MPVTGEEAEDRPAAFEILAGTARNPHVEIAPSGSKGLS